MKSFKLTFLSIVVLSIILLGACSNGDDTASSNNNGNNENTNEETNEETNDEINDATSDEQIVLTLGAQNDNTPATQALIDAFNDSQGEYIVEWDALTNDSAQMHDQLLNSLNSGSSEYDVISMDVVWAGEFAGAGFIETIDVFMNEDGLTKDQFNAGSMDSGNYTGKQYTLPFFPDVGLLYYRSDIVSEEDAALLESGDYTYDDLYDMAEKYTGEEDTRYGFLYQARQYEGLTVNLAEFSGGFSDVQSGLESMYKFTSADFTPDDILNYMEGEAHTNFEQGNAVFARNWPYAYGRIAGEEDGVTVTTDQVGIAPLPNGGTVGGWLLGINSNSEHIDGAWEFIKFAAGEEGQKIMATEGGYLPGVNSLLDNDEVLAGNEMLSYPGFQKALENTLARPVSPEYNKVSDTIQIEAHKYLSSGDGLEDIVKEIEEAATAE